MDSNLKVGSNDAGLFIGDTEILGGGGVANLLKYITISPDFAGSSKEGNIRVLVVNLSDNEDIILYRGNNKDIIHQTNIPKQYIGWYSVDGTKEVFNLYNGGNKRVRSLELQYIGITKIISFSERYANKGQYVNTRIYSSKLDSNEFVFVIIIFNAI